MKEKPKCCTLDCTADAVWRIRFSATLDDYTESCDAHLGEMMQEGNPLRMLLIKIDEPLLKGVSLTEDRQIQ